MALVVCKKCGSVNIYTKESGPHIGAWCCDCNSYIRFLKKDELKYNKELKNQLKNSGATAPTQTNQIRETLQGNQNFTEPAYCGADRYVTNECPFDGGTPVAEPLRQHTSIPVTIAVHGAATIYKHSGVPEYVNESSRLEITDKTIKVFDLATDAFVKEIKL